MEKLNTTDEENDTPLMPVRSLHNFVYCPRLFYFQWVENVFVENSDTAAGDGVHRVVDMPTRLREAGLDMDSQGASFRSLKISSPDLGLIGVIDLAETREEGLEIIDYKKGSARRTESGDRVVKTPDAIQLAAQALLLATQGTQVARAWVYYAEDRRKVEVPLTNELFDSCRNYMRLAREAVAVNTLPEPLQNDPRCLYCSLYPVCLPEESQFWKCPPESHEKEVLRPPRPENDEGETLVVQKAGAVIGFRGDHVEVRYKGDLQASCASHQLRAVYLYGAVQVTAQAAQGLLEKEIPVAYFSAAGRYIGALRGLDPSGIDARKAQYRLFDTPSVRLHLAKRVIAAKIHNQRVMLMRNGEISESDLNEMKRLKDAVDGVSDLDSLRGVEGAAAALYFANFAGMLKSKGYDFDFSGRNRRPPKDPVNALLSLGYSMLAKELAGVCHVVGLDPFVGFFHQPRYGRPALALDLMEEFRPLVADSTAISLLNRGELDKGDFISTSKGVFLNEQGRKVFWEAWFRRMDTQITHPQFKYQMPYRRMFDVQARQLWRFLRGEADDYSGFTTR